MNRHYFDRLIIDLEKEQVSGLFALLLELSSETAEIVFKRYGNDWISNGGATAEPGEILDNFPTARLGKLPSTLNSLLRDLRYARNRLAHQESLEWTDLEPIWDKYVRARESFG